jgi:hypothetical protein
MERIRSDYDADREDKRNSPTTFQTGQNRNEVLCSLCGGSYFVNDVTLDNVTRIAEKTEDNPFVCPDCVEEYEEAAHRP